MAPIEALVRIVDQVDCSPIKRSIARLKKTLGEITKRTLL